MRARVGVRACSGVAVGRLSAHGRGFDSPRDADLIWIALVERLEGQLALADRVSLRLAVDGFVPLVATRLDVLAANGSLLATQPLAPLAVATQIGVGVTFW
jgi:hypothetical protein